MEQILNKEKLINAIKDIPIVAEKDKWVFTFDQDEGSLFYAPRVVSSNSELHQVTDEYAVYLDTNLKPSGVVVEYYKENFLKHNEVLNEVDKKIFKTLKKDEIVVVNPKSKDEIIFKALFENNLIKQIATRMVWA
ncbi:hypothetical protein COW91_01985 [Candidatus Nomurabacteria bacterium CG22_combo_CG10-13_8_21_14_all_32_8]|uniref:Uncharacterized protein n=2 Tax=Candidatus Nomuraibacteriota TaxID=1752729 RepID=A0A2H0CHW3_9BACT|nr:MAG: hypothetical protein COW91_01985 [Candidatus Nomurabacteria bacterium CG22_combo_CG10-13_8_21_14_all_32_8]PIZ85886.1 MAG: hypothetical protein COX94_01740 [Candidatus Nomurabacteria bacterium CG_4_10_14_0_2_um_filter_33_9]